LDITNQTVGCGSLENANMTIDCGEGGFFPYGFNGKNYKLLFHSLSNATFKPKLRYNQRSSQMFLCLYRI
jgi:hypothetical protein